jgi:predicted transcriptional regulator
MKFDPGVFDIPNPQLEEEADARGIADLKAGRVVSHALVKKWLATWGSGRRIPRPKIGD